MRGFVLCGLRRYGDAVEHLKNALAMDTSDNIRWQLVRAYWLQHRTADALALEREAASDQAQHGNDSFLRGFPKVDQALARGGFRAACLESVRLKERGDATLPLQNIALQYGLLEDSGKVLE